MKKLLTTALVLGSTVAIAACSTGITPCNGELDECTYGGPYTEERTIGTSGAAPVVRATAPVRSAEPVFQSSQVK